MYLYSLEEEKMNRALSSVYLWNFLLALESAFALFFIIFVLSMQRRYRITFFSVMTGKQYSWKYFRDADNDKTKVDIFSSHKTYWEDIQVEIEIFIKENYSVWVDESPPWFTENVRLSIPRSMIPRDEMRAESDEVKRIEVAQEHRRRSSIAIAAEVLEQAAQKLTVEPSIQGDVVVDRLEDNDGWAQQ